MPSGRICLKSFMNKKDSDCELRNVTIMNMINR